MAKSIKISIDTAVYRIPTEEDIQAAKDFILQREECAVLLGTLHGYLYKTMKDWEAAIAAMMYVGWNSPRR